MRSQHNYAKKLLEAHRVAKQGTVNAAAGDLPDIEKQQNWRTLKSFSREASKSQTTTQALRPSAQSVSQTQPINSCCPLLI